MLELKNLSFKVDNEDGSGALHIIEDLTSLLMMVSL